MPENIIELPDGKKLVVFETNQHPDFTGTSINVQEVLSADIPTYVAQVNAVAPAANKNILAIWNNLTNKRIRVQEVYVYPFSLANHVVTLQLGYINSAPAGGTAANINRYAFDFPDPQDAAPNTVTAHTGITNTPVANVIFGGNTFSVNTPGTYIIFEKKGNGSAIQLRPGGVEGLVLRQTSGSGTTGSLSAGMVFTLD